MPGMDCDAISAAVGEIERKRWTTGEISARDAEIAFQRLEEELLAGGCGAGIIRTHLSTRITSNITATIHEQTAEISRRTASNYRIMTMIILTLAAGAWVYHVSESR